jgi:uncharacterized protein (DUF2267 family)
MDARTFYAQVAGRSSLSKEEAADLTRATIEALAQRLSAGEARDLARQLPDDLVQAVRWDGKHSERFGLDELITRVSNRTGLNESETTTGARAVLTTLREVIDAKEFDDLMAQLPAEFATLVLPARQRG